eukprot:218453_1
MPSTKKKSKNKDKKKEKSKKSSVSKESGGWLSWFGGGNKSKKRIIPKQTTYTDDKGEEKTITEVPLDELQENEMKWDEDEKKWKFYDKYGNEVENNHDSDSSYSSGSESDIDEKTNDDQEDINNSQMRPTRYSITDRNIKSASKIDNDSDRLIETDINSLRSQIFKLKKENKSLKQQLTSSNLSPNSSSNALLLNNDNLLLM